MTMQEPTSIRTKKKRLQKRNRQLWGRQLKEIRENVGLSRSALLLSYHQNMEKEMPDYPIRGEAWLARIEREEQRNVDRIDMEMLFKALGCSENQRLYLLMRADRNPLTSKAGELTDEAVFLIFVMAYINATLDIQTRQLIRSAVTARKIVDLNHVEMLEIFFDVLEILKKNSWAQQSRSNAALSS